MEYNTYLGLDFFLLLIKHRILHPYRVRNCGCVDAGWDSVKKGFYKQKIKKVTIILNKIKVKKVYVAGAKHVARPEG
jgi:hypothetical protein